MIYIVAFTAFCLGFLAGYWLDSAIDSVVKRWEYWRIPPESLEDVQLRNMVDSMTRKIDQDILAEVRKELVI